ncbi:MAG: anti-sigma factor [Actinobacteria bacterium]|nr:anti-sigma factor [Actinomycetota bacterium]
MDLHDLTAAYALDALDADESEAYEQHLGRCEDCRAQLAELTETAAALAFAAPAPAPPTRLRAAILDTAHAERTNVVPLVRRRWVTRTAVLAAAAAACVVVGVVVASTHSGPRRLASAVVVLGANGTATLQISGLGAAPHGKTYEAWVIPSGGRARPAGLFTSGAARIRLGAVPSKAVVAVTVEHAGGATAPTTAPVISARV